MAKTRIKSSAAPVGTKEGTLYHQMTFGHSTREIHMFIAYTMFLNARLVKIGKISMAGRYATSVNSLRRYLNGGDVALKKIDGTLMQGYERWLKDHGLCRNTTSFYMRNLRCIYNHAVEEGLVTAASPFRHVYTGIDKTVKRAVTLETIRKIRNLNLLSQPHLDFARDMFMFSFYTRGMSFIDMAFLKKKDLHNGILVYRRHKTDQLLMVKWEKPMQDIVDKYDTSDTVYMLPIIKNIGKDELLQYRNEAHRINRNLKKIGEMLGLCLPLTIYVARHGWASIAKSKNIPISTISEAMGHDSETTTRIYLASLDTSMVDKANSIILKSL